MLSVEFGIHRPLSSRRALEQGTGLITQIVLSPLPARMGTLSASSGTQGPTLDVQVLQGLETYITTEKFLHTLEAASAEWIDLSDHKQQPHKAWGSSSSELELSEVQQQHQAALPQHVQPTPPQAQASTTSNQPSSSTSRSGSFLSRWRRSTSSTDRSTSNTSSSPPSTAELTSTPGTGKGSSSTAGNASQPSSSLSTCATAAASSTTSTFELVEPQAPLTESIMQEPFVLVSAEDAIEGMAYYIALYLSRAPEARYMEPKQLQAALRQTMTAIRRSRYRVIWDWGRSLYRWGAVSYSALQLYEHPWLVRAVVCGVWASSKMAFGVLF